MKSRVCIIGLGNPGAKYRGTRHNIGFDWVDCLLEKWEIAEKDFKEKYDSLWLKTHWEGFEIHILKPQTFMNESGRALSKWLGSNQGDGRVLVVYDDVDLPLGRVRLRYSGSDGGHRGLRSIIEQGASENIPRLRLGVGRPAASDTIDHVLSRFKPEEKDVISKMLLGSEDQLRAFLVEPSEERAMSKINGLNYGPNQESLKE